MPRRNGGDDASRNIGRARPRRSSSPLLIAGTLMVSAGSVASVASAVSAVSAVTSGAAGAAAAGSGGSADAGHGALAAVEGAAGRTHGQSASVTMSLAAARIAGVAPPPIRGTGAFTFSVGTGRAVLHQQGGTETVLFVPSSLFVKVATHAKGALPPGKTWISAGLTEVPVLSANFPHFVLQAEGVNPTFLLDELTWGAVSARPLGPSTVDGIQARAYSVQVRPSLAAARATGPSAAGFARAVAYELQALGASGSGPAPRETVRVWLGPDGGIVRLQASPPGSGVGTTTMSLRPQRGEVRVTAPPRQQVVDIAKLIPGGERENTGGGDSDGA